jgi:SHS2 domain-containing protein
MKIFEVVDHTADIGIKAYGKTPQQVFENAAVGMFSLMADLSGVEEKESFDIEAEGEDRESLLVDWLNELLYVFETKEMLLKRFEVTKWTEHHLLGKAYGEKINLKKHQLEAQIKAATYHMLKVSHNDTWLAQVIFDV